MEATVAKQKFGTAPVYFTAISTILGAILFLRFGYGALMVPATITGSIGLGYAAYRQLQLRQERTGAT